MPSYEQVQVNSQSQYIKYISSASTNLSTVANATSAASVITATVLSGHTTCGVNVSAMGRGTYSYIIHRLEFRFNITRLQEYGTVTLTDDASSPNLNKAVTFTLAAAAAPTDASYPGCYAYFTPAFNPDVDNYSEFIALAELPELQMIGAGRTGTFPNTDSESWTTGAQPNVGLIEDVLNTNENIGVMIRHENDRNHSTYTTTSTTLVDVGLYNYSSPPQLVLRVVPRTLYFGANF